MGFDHSGCRADLANGRIAPALRSRRSLRCRRAVPVARAYVHRTIRAQDTGVTRDLADFVRWTAAAPSGVRGLQNDIANIRHAHVQSQAVDVRVPTLVLHGADDRFVPVDHGRYYTSAIAGARLETTTGGGHLFLQAFRATTSERIGRFLDSNR